MVLGRRRVGDDLRRHSRRRSRRPARFFIAIGVTEVIGSTPSTSTSFSCSTKDEDGVQLALQMRDVVFGDRDAREPRDAADRLLVDRHEGFPHGAR